MAFPEYTGRVPFFSIAECATGRTIPINRLIEDQYQQWNACRSEANLNSLFAAVLKALVGRYGEDSDIPGLACAKAWPKIDSFEYTRPGCFEGWVKTLARYEELSARTDTKRVRGRFQQFDDDAEGSEEALTADEKFDHAVTTARLQQETQSYFDQVELACREWKAYSLTRSSDPFLAQYARLKLDGLKDSAIAKKLGVTPSNLSGKLATYRNRIQQGKPLEKLKYLKVAA